MDKEVQEYNPSFKEINLDFADILLNQTSTNAHLCDPSGRSVSSVQVDGYK